MASLKMNGSLADYQKFVSEVYGANNQKHFTIDEMLSNIGRFLMRGLKGVRKGNTEKIELNMTIALSWFMSAMGQLGIDLDSSVWKRFPYVCSYCGECPCACSSKKIQKRVALKIDPKLKPKTIHGFQKMFNDIYPAHKRTLENAGIHLAEEFGELSEAVLKFRGHHSDHDFEMIALEASDLFSCFMGLFNSIHFDYEKSLVSLFGRGCHICKRTPCVCEYSFVIDFKS